MDISSGHLSDSSTDDHQSAIHQQKGTEVFSCIATCHCRGNNRTRHVLKMPCRSTLKSKRCKSTYPGGASHSIALRVKYLAAAAFPVEKPRVTGLSSFLPRKTNLKAWRAFPCIFGLQGSWMPDINFQQPTFEHAEKSWPHTLLPRSGDSLPSGVSA